MDRYPSKAQWGAGPWQQEPDELEWVDEATGYKCRIHRALPHSGHLNGYVAIPPTHPAFGLYYDGVTWQEAQARRGHWEREAKRVRGNIKDWQPGPDYSAFPGIGEAIEKIEVHGGLTYAGPFPIDPASPQEWWFGFDCAHAFDLCPAMQAFMHRLHIDRGDTKKWEAMQAKMKGLRYQDTYRTIDYVRNECSDLARQLKALEGPPYVQNRSSADRSGDI